jgi:hypothetical protein
MLGALPISQIDLLKGYKPRQHYFIRQFVLPAENFRRQGQVNCVNCHKSIGIDKVYACQKFRREKNSQTPEV